MCGMVVWDAKVVSSILALAMVFFLPVITMFSQPSYPTPSSGGPAFFPSSQSLSGLSFSDTPSASLSHQFPPSIAVSHVEATSPEAFKEHIQLALSQVAGVHALARNVLLAT